MHTRTLGVVAEGAGDRAVCRGGKLREILINLQDYNVS
jgi:hypothetical protein